MGSTGFGPKYSPETKAAAIEACRNKGNKSWRELSSVLGISIKTLREWTMNEVVKEPLEVPSVPAGITLFDIYRAAALIGILASDQTSRQPERLAEQADAYAKEMMRGREV